MKEGGDGVSPSCRICCSTSSCFQAFLIAFASDFLPSAYHGYVHSSSLHGYVNSTLAYTSRDFVLQSNTPRRWDPAPASPGSSFLRLGFCLSLPLPQQTFCLAE